MLLLLPIVHGSFAFSENVEGTRPASHFPLQDSNGIFKTCVTGDIVFVWTRDMVEPTGPRASLHPFVLFWSNHEGEVVMFLESLHRECVHIYRNPT